MTEETTAPEPAQEEAFDYKDKYLRLLAEMENTRKRMQKEKLETMRFAIDNVLAEIIIPMDSLENALKSASQMSGEIRNWAMGFEMILSQFKDVLQQNGVVAFASEGQVFDPHLHEAVETEENEGVSEGTILKEFVKGYRCGDRVIRPARGRVAKKLKQGE